MQAPACSIFTVAETRRPCARRCPLLVRPACYAGAPRAVIRRAEELLEQLQAGHTPAAASNGHGSQQLALFAADSGLHEDLARLDPLNMTPLEALNALAPFDADRKAIMQARIDRRAARATHRQPPTFLDPRSTIARTSLVGHDA